MSASISLHSSPAAPTSNGVKWPDKYNLFGVQVSATDYEQAVDCLTNAARLGTPAIASFQAVHPIVMASGDGALRKIMNSFELLAPDGQPVRWALNLLHKAGLRERVYGPELMLRLCARAAEQGLPIYLYGGTPDVLSALKSSLGGRFPALQIAGCYAPPFRPLTGEERDRVVGDILSSGARLLFIGLGAPKQDLFAFEQRERLPLVQVCVGAAFDLHAGVKRMAPRWMQKAGLEWLFRVVQEPRRLWRRYAVTNSLFLWKLLLALGRKAAGGTRPARRIARRLEET